MTTQQRMQHYMERHRLGPLFEDLMNRVLHDQPDEPLLYVIKLLYKKAGLEIPQDLKLGAVRRSSPDRLARRSKSPEFRKSTTQAWASGSAEGLVGKGPGYDKPWLSNSKKMRPKSPDKDVTKTAAHIKVSKHSVRQLSAQELHKRSKSAAEILTKSDNVQVESFFDDLLQVKPLTPRPYEPMSPRSQKPLTPRSPKSLTPHSPVRKQKTGWNPGTNVKSTAFDDIFQENPKQVKKTEAGANVRNAWATIGLGDGDDGLYSSHGYRGPRTNRNDEDPLAGEIMPSKGSKVSKERTTPNTSMGHVRGPKYDANKHQKELEQLLHDCDKRSTDSGYIEEQDLEQDDAIELLEDAEELKREGARNIKPSGYKLSRILKQRQQDANVKLNINLYTGPMPGDRSLEDDSLRRYNSIPDQSPFDSDQDERPATGMSGYQPGDSDVDEEFESVSQVTGPRKPVWNIDDSDGESYKPKPSRTLPEPSRSRGGMSENRKLAATAPVRFDDRAYPTKSVDSVDSFLNPSAAKTWTGDRESNIEGGSQIVQRSTQESVRSESGGWAIPRYESDTSITDWSPGKSKGRRPPPRAY